MFYGLVFFVRWVNTGCDSLTGNVATDAVLPPTRWLVIVELVSVTCAGQAVTLLTLA